MTAVSRRPGLRGWPHAVGPLLNPLRLRIRRALAKLPAPLAEFIMFGLKQAWACLFAALMLGLLIGTHLVWQPGWPIYRYDAIFLGAVLIQAVFLGLTVEYSLRPGVILPQPRLTSWPARLSPDSTSKALHAICAREGGRYRWGQLCCRTRWRTACK